MKNQTIERLVEEVTAKITDLPARDALKVIHAVEGRIINGAAFSWEGERANAVLQMIIHPKGSISRIDLDPEVKALILSTTEQTTLRALRIKITNRFGANRTPSKSAISRWLRRQSGATGKT